MNMLVVDNVFMRKYAHICMQDREWKDDGGTGRVSQRFESQRVHITLQILLPSVTCPPELTSSYHPLLKKIPIVSPSQDPIHKLNKTSPHIPTNYLAHWPYDTYHQFL